RIPRAGPVIFSENLLRYLKSLRILGEWEVVSVGHRVWFLARAFQRDAGPQRNGLPCFDKRPRVLDRRRGENPMTQVKDVTYAPGAFNRLPGGPANSLLRPQQKRRVHVSLQGDVLAENLSCLAEVYAPVHAQHVRSGALQTLQQM